MVEWKYEIDIKEAWKTNDPMLITNAIVTELERIKGEMIGIDQRGADLLLFAFTRLKSHPSKDKLDELMSSLYDWADAASVWVATVV